MLKNMYTIKDNKVGFGAPIFYAPNNAVAIRTFADTVRKEEYINEHAEDFELWCLGQFSEETGEIISTPAFLERAGSFIDAK